MTILEHEHNFEEVYDLDQMYLTDGQKEKLGVDTSVDYYTDQTCSLKPCTATKLNSGKKPLDESLKPVVDLDAYKLSKTGSL